MRTNFGFLGGLIYSPTQIYHIMINISNAEGDTTLSYLSTSLSTDGIYYSRLDSSNITTVDEIVRIQGVIISTADEDTSGYGGTLFRIKLQKYDTCWARFNICIVSGNFVTGYTPSYSWVTG